MDSLIKVRSFLGVAEAELARIRLAMDGISARLSNTEMVIWFWHYSNATGGVKLFVNSSDLPQAALILSSRPAAGQCQAPNWICPKCQADVEGSWSFCWSCGTSMNNDEDPDFHTWYRESPDVSRSTKLNTESIVAIISVLSIVLFIVFRSIPVVLFVWLIVLIHWIVISRELSTKREALINAGDLGLEREPFSDTHYDPSRDEFNPADETAYKLWKAAIFSFASSLIFFPFALWLWYKTNKKALSLSEKGLHYYFYSLLFLIISILWHGWILLVASFHLRFDVVRLDLFM